MKNVKKRHKTLQQQPPNNGYLRLKTPIKKFVIYTLKYYIPQLYRFQQRLSTRFLNMNYQTMLEIQQLESGHYPNGAIQNGHMPMGQFMRNWNNYVTKRRAHRSLERTYSVFIGNNGNSRQKYKKKKEMLIYLSILNAQLLNLLLLMLLIE